MSIGLVTIPTPGEIAAAARHAAHAIITRLGDYECMERYLATLQEWDEAMVECSEQLACAECPRPMMSLAETPNCSVWLLGWRPALMVAVGEADATDIHDHGDSLAMIQVIAGEVEEVVYTPISLDEFARDGGGMVIAETCRHRVGKVLTVPCPYIHIFDAKPESAFAASLHIYSPPLTRMGLYDEVLPTGDRPGPLLLQLRGMWVR